MQIVCKVKEGRIEDAKEAVAGRLAAVLPEHAQQASVEQVFPGLKTGRRARLFTIELPDDVPARKVEELVETLRNDDAVESADIPAEKRPL